MISARLFMLSFFAQTVLLPLWLAMWLGCKLVGESFVYVVFFHRKVEFRLSIAVPDGPIDHVGFGVAFVLFFMNAIILQNKTLFQGLFSCVSGWFKNRQQPAHRSNGRGTPRTIC